MCSLKSRVEKLEQHQSASLPEHSAQFDYDAGTIYRGMLYLDGTMCPSYDRVEPAEVYARGKELHEKRYGPIIPAYLDPHLKRSTLASIEFEFIFDREPKVGDILRFDHIATLRDSQANNYYFGEFIAAWHRQLSHLECPLRFEDDTLFKRLMPERRLQDGRWEQDSRIGPEQKWWGIECEMNRRLGMSTLHAEEGLALAFLGVSAVDGKHECRPATAEELRAPEIEFEQLCRNGFTHEQMSAKHWHFKMNEILITVFGE
jgi:hypothetical protein